MTTAFVLGGGGRWGAVEVGMLRALQEFGIAPDMIIGTSIGALNGSVIADANASDPVERLTKLWNEISEGNIFNTSLKERAGNLTLMKPAIHGNDGLREALEHAHGVGRNIEDLSIKFECVAASIERAAEHWFTSGALVPALLASSAIPALLPPVEIDGELFYDGGLVNSVPIDRAVELGATRIFVLQVGRIESPLRAPKRLHEAALISFEIARRHRFGSGVERLPEGVEHHMLPSGNPVEFDDRRQLRWRDTGDTSRLIDGAYQASTEYLKQLT